MQYDYRDTSPLRAFFRGKWVRVILVVDIAVIFIIIGILIWQATKVSVIDFNIAPVDAVISVNGSTNYSNGQFKVTPGAYEISISRDGLEPKTLSVNIEPQQVVTVTLFLAGIDNDFEFYELSDNFESYKKLKSIASADENITSDGDTSAEQFILDFEHRMSIFDVLPIKGYVYANPNIGASTAGFTIRNGQGGKKCEKIACILVNYYGSGYEDAVMGKIKEAGYNPDDYQYVYERYN